MNTPCFECGCRRCECPVASRPARPEGWRLTEFGEALVHAVLRTARDHGQLRPDSDGWVCHFVGSMMLPSHSAVVHVELTDAEREWIAALIAEYIAGDDLVY